MYVQKRSNEGKENNSSTSEKKYTALGDYVYIYEWEKPLFHLMHERACTEKSVSLSNTEEVVAEYKSDYESMVQCINVYHKESERRAVYSKQSTAGFEGETNITINRARLITPEKQSGNEEYCQVNPRGKN